MKKFEDIVSENELILLRYYNDSLSKIKQQMLKQHSSDMTKHTLNNLSKMLKMNWQNLKRNFNFIQLNALQKFNNVGIGKIALILGASSTAVSKWIRNAHKLLQELLENFNPLASEKADIIELDEIYTYVKKEKSYFSIKILFCLQ